MTNATVFDTRKHIRVYFADEVDIYLIAQSSSGNILEIEELPLNATGQNLSEGGMSFKFDHPQELSSIFKVCFKIQEPKLVEAYARRIWKTNHFFGVQFFILDEDSRNQIRCHVNKQIGPKPHYLYKAPKV